VFDPEVIEANGQKYIYYGSYFGGISARKLSADGLHSDPASQQQVAIDNKYEGANIYGHSGYYYLFLSATDCCRGPLTGYSVFAGRSTSPLGPFVDKEGVSLLAGRAGGTPVISMNGNRWVGPGHNTVLTDFAGQDWLVYHAVDRNHPYFAGAVGFTKRPALLDPLDWVDGWPTVRGGLWASDQAQPVPAAHPGQKSNYTPTYAQPDLPGERVDSLSDEFNASLGPAWSWVRQPASGAGVANGNFNFDTQAADLFEGSNNASVLVEPAPSDDYIVETRVKLNRPDEGCCFNYVQAGLVIYGGDDNFIKLVHVSIWNTRQTEIAKELFPVPPGYPRYGNTVVGPPGEWTYLRIVKRTGGAEEFYRAYTSRDGVSWVRGGVWTHNLGGDARIGLVSMGGAGFTANFDYVRVYQL
jgi:arabinan endo-1,5-alpha-L-arabinosidase